MNEFTFTKTGFEQYMYWQKQDKKILKRIIDELKNIKILSCKGHYEE